MTAAMPKPCGATSSQRCHAGECSFHRATSAAATTVRRHEHSVSEYSLPVRRMTLGKRGHVGQCAGLQAYAVHESTDHPANTLPVDMATWQRGQIGRRRGQACTYGVRQQMEAWHSVSVDG